MVITIQGTRMEYADIIITLNLITVLINAETNKKNGEILDQILQELKELNNGLHNDGNRTTGN